MAEKTADIQKEIESLAGKLNSLGFNVDPKDPQAVAKAGVELLRDLNRVFGNGQDIEHYSDEVLLTAQAGLNEDLKAEDLENLQAIFRKDLDALVKDVNVLLQSTVKKKIQSIYDEYPDDINKATIEILKLKDSAEINSFIALSQQNAPYLLSNLEQAVSILSKRDELFQELQAVGGAEEYKDVTLGMSEAEKFAERIKAVEAIIGINAPDGEWGLEEQQALKAFTLKLQQDEYFGRGLTLQDKRALPDHIRQTQIFTDENGEEHPYSDEQNGIYTEGFAITVLNRALMMPDIKLKVEAPKVEPEAEPEAEAQQGTQPEPKSKLAPRMRRAQNLKQQHNQAAQTVEQTEVQASDIKHQSMSDLFASKEDAVEFARTLQAMQRKGFELKEPIDRLSLDEASTTVEMGLSLVADSINDALEGAKGNFIAQFIAADLLSQRIPDIDPSKIGGQFDISSQASLQAFMSILSHPRVLNLPEESGPDWYYTPGKGQIILSKLKDTENPPQFLSMLSDEQKVNFNKLIEGDNLEKLITALDYMHSRGQLVDYELLLGMDVAPMTQDIIGEQIERFEADGNEAAISLMDGLIYKLGKPFNLNTIMGEEHLKDPMGNTDNPEAKIALFYNKAREHYLANKDKLSEYEDFNAYLLPMLDAMETLPFGFNEHRQDWKSRLTAAIHSAQGDGEAFAKAVQEAREQIAQDHGPVSYVNSIAYSQSLTPIVDPRLKEFGTLSSNGQSYNVNDIIRLYRDVHTVHAMPEDRSLGQISPIYMHSYVPFKDDDGNIFIAATDRESMTFTVQELSQADLDIMRLYLAPDLILKDENASAEAKEEAQKVLDHLSNDERYDRLRKAVPAFALVCPKNGGSMTSSPRDFYYFMTAKADNIPGLSASIAEYSSRAKGVLKHAKSQPDGHYMNALDAKALVSEFARQNGYDSEKVKEEPLPKPDSQDFSALNNATFFFIGNPRALTDKELALYTRNANKDLSSMENNKYDTVRLENIRIAPNPNNEKMCAYVTKRDANDLARVSKSTKLHTVHIVPESDPAYQKIMEERRTPTLDNLSGLRSKFKNSYLNQTPEPAIPEESKEAAPSPVTEQNNIV